MAHSLLGNALAADGRIDEADRAVSDARFEIKPDYAGGPITALASPRPVVAEWTKRSPIIGRRSTPTATMPMPTTTSDTPCWFAASLTKPWSISGKR